MNTSTKPLTNPPVGISSSAPELGHGKLIVASFGGVVILCFCATLPFDYSKELWAVLLAGLVLAVVSRRQHLGGLRINIPLLAFCAWIAMSSFWSVRRGTTLYQVAMQVSFSLMGCLLAVGRTRAQLLRLVALTCSGFLLVNLLDAALRPGSGIGTNDEGHAVRGFFVDKNQFGFFATFTLLASVHHLLTLREGPPATPGARGIVPLARRSSVAWVAVAVCVAAVLASTSKTALSVAVASMGLTWLFRWVANGRRPMLVRALGSALLVAIAAVMVAANWDRLLRALGRNPSLTGRTRIWWAVENAIRERPWTGYGWKALWIEGDPTTERIWAWNYNVPFFHAHDGYLDITAQAGIIGLILLIFFWASVLAHSAKEFIRQPTSATQWPIVTMLVVMVYNGTEVVAIVNTAWVIVTCLSCLAPEPEELPDLMPDDAPPTKPRRASPAFPPIGTERTPA